MSLQTEQTAREREATKPLPFEESIVLAISRANKDGLRCLAGLILITKIRANYVAISSAWRSRGVALSLRDYTNVLDHIEAQQKTAEARKQARADENLR